MLTTALCCPQSSELLFGGLSLDQKDPELAYILILLVLVHGTLWSLAINGEITIHLQSTEWSLFFKCLCTQDGAYSLRTLLVN